MERIGNLKFRVKHETQVLNVAVATMVVPVIKEMKEELDMAIAEVAFRSMNSILRAATTQEIFTASRSGNGGKGGTGSADSKCVSAGNAGSTGAS